MIFSTVRRLDLVFDAALHCTMSPVRRAGALSDDDDEADVSGDTNVHLLVVITVVSALCYNSAPLLFIDVHLRSSCTTPLARLHRRIVIASYIVFVAFPHHLRCRSMERETGNNRGDDAGGRAGVGDD